MPTAQPVIGYLLKTFPKLSETFILNEILELERQGVNLHIFSLRPPQDRHCHPGVSRVKAPITYIPSLLPDHSLAAEAALLGAHYTLLERYPCRYQQMLRFYLARREEKHINEFLQGGYLATELAAHGIEHLHVHFANTPTATAEIAHQFSDIPYSVTAHAKDIYLSDAAALNRRFAKAEFVLTCTDYNRRYLESISTSATPIHLSYHGIDLTRFNPSESETRFLSPDLGAESSSLPETGVLQPEIQLLGLEATPVKILSVGRFCEKKGFPYLLQACHLLKESLINFECRIVGYGPLQAQLNAMIQELDLADQVTLVGQLTQDQVIEQYRWADMFVLPCLVTEDGDRDGIPNVLLEAMAMGVPVISTTISGITELIEPRQTGLLVPPENVTDLAAAIALLTQDDQLRHCLGQAGCRTVRQNFTLERNVGQVRDLLLTTLCAPMAALPLSPSLEALI
ncbi:MAG: colanic acid biosynthesis glycosyltransferase WcaL [Leptolyngbyaceae cyanobacterium SM2_5_2]|nr:colanic acid biosynthesis glycosyltransferase WcaL [Leptolyngbyaceae cyanobacterium SM2_5_2]